MSRDERRIRHFRTPASEAGNIVAFAVTFVLVLFVAGLLYFGGTFALPGG